MSDNQYGFNCAVAVGLAIAAVSLLLVGDPVRAGMVTAAFAAVVYRLIDHHRKHR